MTDGELTQAELFDVFSNARRRRTVEYLKQTGGSCDLSALVEHVAAWENDLNPDAVSRTQRRRVYISLYQTHLPMLEDHGVVDWDPNTHAIELLPNEETFEPYLDRSIGESREWQYLYATVSGATLLALAFSWLSIGPLGVWAIPLVVFACCVLTLAIAVVQNLSRSRSLRFGSSIIE
ncbi:hypothetical protein OB905_02660 [Halobacteria archaeon AArc-dxtr1]|nr:hypothetical protein [Halobacteria archaeon AArc-dxtr1]